jgi:Domain of unknown function (DUF4864)
MGAPLPPHGIDFGEIGMAMERHPGAHEGQEGALVGAPPGGEVPRAAAAGQFGPGLEDQGAHAAAGADLGHDGRGFVFLTLEERQARGVGLGQAMNDGAVHHPRRGGDKKGVGLAAHARQPESPEPRGPDTRRRQAPAKDEGEYVRVAQGAEKEIAHGVVMADDPAGFKGEGRWKMRIARHMAFGLIAGLIFLSAAAAQTSRPAAPADGAAIRDVISRQVAAFRRDDAESAFALASPRVRQQFGVASNFIVMVREGYAAVYRPRDFVFGGLTVEGEEAVQEVHVTGPDGTPVTAVYLMQRQPDGAWRIDGCVLLPSAQTRT